MQSRDHYKTLRVKLRDARIAAGLTQTDVAKRLGKPQSYVSKIETGERQIDVIEFVELALASGSHPSAILSDLYVEMFGRE